MRLVTYLQGDRARVGVVGADDTVSDLDDLVPGSPSDMISVIEAWLRIAPRLREAAGGAGIPLDRARLLAPIPRPRRNVLCVGWNYAEHFAEGREFRSPAGVQEIPDHPALFTKSPAAVIGPDAHVRHPGPHSGELDWEVELAVIVGRGGRDIREKGALEHVFGYTVGNDVSVRDVQRARHGGQWFKGKSFDTHCPLGPWIVTADEIPDPQVLDISSRVNGETMQSATTAQMVFPVARIIAELSAGMALEPGDVILTGTPPGVGFARKPPRFLKVGDVMEMEIGGIGVLRNAVAPYDA
ncbi:MAG: fumarylacetoacetate hydrolase family protein [Chloroflexi bacterium]|nr:fumarylacetoacetate hydrolase family protein [Chloroflexota bacterium]